MGGLLFGGLIMALIALVAGWIQLPWG